MFNIEIISLLSIIFLLLILLLIKNSQSKNYKKQINKIQYFQDIFDITSLPTIYISKNKKEIIENPQFKKAFGSYKKEILNELSKISSTCTKKLVLTYDNNIKKMTEIFASCNLDKNTQGMVYIFIDIEKEYANFNNIVKQKNKLQYALNHSQIGYWSWDVKKDIFELSSMGKKILGYVGLEEIPKNINAWLNLVKPYDLATTNELLAQHIENKSKFLDIEHRLKIGDENKWVNVKAQAIFDTQGKATKVYGTICDISEKNKKVVKIQKERDLYFTFMDSLPALAFIKNKKGQYSYINTFYKKLLGFISWKNKSADDMFEPQIAQSINESDREAMYEGIEKHEEHVPNEEGEVKLFQTYKFPVEDGSEKVLCGFGLDVTQEKLYQQKVDLYAKVFNNTVEGIIITDENNLIVAVNNAFTTITGFSQKEVFGKNPNIRSSGKHDKTFYAHMWENIIQNESWQGEIFNKSKNGAIMPELMNISTIKNTENKITNYIGTFQSIEQQKNTENRLKKLAHFDELTNLPNRALFHDRLGRALNRASRENSLVGIIFVDLDDFKIINDTYGHNSGDIVLKEVANRLLETLRDSDTAARLGGDEFVIVLEKVRQITDISYICEKIITVLTKPIILENGAICKIGASIGISIYPKHATEQSNLLEYADIAMYDAKKSGKNCYKIYKGN